MTDNGTTTVAVESFGTINNDDMWKDGVTEASLVRVALNRIDTLVGLDEIDTIVTGMNEWFTHTLIEVIDEDGHDIDVDPFYPRVNDFEDDDGVESRREAWVEAYDWRNRKLLGDNDYPSADIFLRVCDAGRNGEAFTKTATQSGTLSGAVPIDDAVIDREKAYGDDEADAEADTGSDNQAETEA